MVWIESWGNPCRNYQPRLGKIVAEEGTLIVGC